MDVENPQLLPPLISKYEIELPKYKRAGEPDHYRLSAARLRATKREPSTALVVSGHSKISFVALLVRDPLRFRPCREPVPPPPAYSRIVYSPVEGSQLDWILHQSPPYLCSVLGPDCPSRMFPSQPCSPQTTETGRRGSDYGGAV